MKLNPALIIASFATLVTIASAAQSQIDSELVVMPAYVVTAPRHQAIEQRINASLDELRQQTQAFVATATEFCLMTAPVKPSATLHITQQEKVPRFTKL